MPPLQCSVASSPPYLHCDPVHLWIIILSSWNVFFWCILHSLVGAYPFCSNETRKNLLSVYIHMRCIKTQHSINFFETGISQCFLAYKCWLLLAFTMYCVLTVHILHVFGQSASCYCTYILYGGETDLVWIWSHEVKGHSRSNWS